MLPRHAHRQGRVEPPSRASALLARLRARWRAFADDDHILHNTPGSSPSRYSGGYMSRNREWREQTRAEFARGVSETAAKLRGRR